MEPEPVTSKVELQQRNSRYQKAESDFVKPDIDYGYVTIVA